MSSRVLDSRHYVCDVAHNSTKRLRAPDEQLTSALKRLGGVRRTDVRADTSTVHLCLSDHIRLLQL